MYGLNEEDGFRSRCLFTKLEMSSTVNLERPSASKKPFSVILKQPYTHTLEVLIPKPATEAFRRALDGGVGTLKYAKVHLKLLDIIQGEFFNQYIKSGNITMLSSGRPNIDPLFSFSEGILRLEVDRPTFERMGLEGKPMPHEGRKHVKSRYLVELNLRLSSMVRGRKGFERVVWTFKNVLTHTVTWLFYDHNAAATDVARPIDEHQPLVHNVEGAFKNLDNLKVPDFPLNLGENDYVEACEMLEWISLAINGSPRVHGEDQIDPALSRYQVPYWLNGSQDASQLGVQDLVKIKWRGFITPGFALKIFLAALKVSKQRWMAVSASHFNGEGYSILYTEKKCLIWEYKD